MSGAEMGMVKKIWDSVSDRLAAIQGLDRGP